MVYCVIILFLLVGNLIVIFIVWRNNSMWSVINFFIGNLVVSDFLIMFFGMLNMII